MVLPSETTARARTVLDLTLSGPPTLGDGHLLCIDGPAGSGKTTLAGALLELAPNAVVLHTDEMLEGWRGLPGLAASIETLLAPLVQGEPGNWRRWDWDADCWAERHTVAPCALLVLEGVGSWAPAYAKLVSALAWQEVPLAERVARWLARDGVSVEPFMVQWFGDEDELHQRLHTRHQASIRW